MPAVPPLFPAHLGQARRPQLPILVLIFTLMLLAPGTAGAADYVFTTDNTWIMDSSGSITNAGTINGTWTLASSPASSKFSGAIRVDAAATIINTGTINLSGSIASGRQYLYAMHSDSGAFLVTMINQGAISVETTDNFSVRGMYSVSDHTYAVNSGTITTIAYGSGSSQGVYMSEDAYFNNSGTVTSIAYGDNFARALCMDAANSTGYNSGSLAAESYGSEYSAAVYLRYGATFYNTGSLSATTHGTGDARAAYIRSGSTFYNTGTLSATALGGGNAYAVYVDENNVDIHLQTGTRILGGAVHSSANTADLFLDGQGTADFDITGTWGTLNKTDTGTWTISKAIAATIGTLNVTGGKLDLTGGMANAITDLNLSSGAVLSLPTSMGLTATGTAALDGTLYIDASAAALGTTTVLTAGTLNTGAGYNAVGINPDFTVNVATTTGAGGTVQATTSFTPADDNAALGTTATLASARAFADVAGTRGLTLLAQADDKDEEILVAANGSMSGLLGGRSEEKPWAIYLQPVVTTISRDKEGRVAGFDTMLVGFEGGVERMVGDNLAIGAMAGVGTVDVSFTDNAFGTSDNEDQTLYTLGVYGGYRMDDWKFTDTLTATYTEHDSSRAAGLGQTAGADYDSWMLSNRFLAVYDWHPVQDWTISPRAGLNLSWLYRGEFEEDGAVNAVAYDAMNEIITEAVLGVRATYAAIDVHGADLTPYVGAGLVHTLTGADFTVRQRLATASADVKTENDTDRLTAEAGMTLSRDDVSFTLSYDGTWAERSDGHAFTGTLGWAF